MANILALHHEHMNLLKPFCFVLSKNVFDQLICRTKKQKARLQCLASAMPKPVMPSGAKNGKVCKEKKCKKLAVLAKRRDRNVFLSAKLLSTNVKTV